MVLAKLGKLQPLLDKLPIKNITSQIAKEEEAETSEEVQQSEETVNEAASDQPCELTKESDLQ